ncbi:MAG: biotin synthase BioB [Thermodesulfobacteriota bacterium]
MTDCRYSKEIDAHLGRLKSGELLDFETAYSLGRNEPVSDLCGAADDLRRHFHGDSFDLCSIINARSGNCSEDCRYCAQSARYTTGAESYQLIADDLALEQALENDSAGVDRLSLVTAGRTVSTSQLRELATLYRLMEARTDLLFCGSLGLLDRKKAEQLRSMGVIRYHCNLESCREFFPSICTSHSWEDKVETLKIARDAGMDLCSGGIIGMGESFSQRLQLAFELRELDVLSIPVNILTPIPGTPLGDLAPLSTDEVLRTVAMFRLINPQAVIRLAGGRNQLDSDQYRCFTGGANGAIVGNYLTTAGNSLDGDIAEIGALGFTFRRREPDNG